MVDLTSHQTVRRSAAIENIDRSEDSPGLHLMHHRQRNRAPGILSPAMIVIEIQLLGRFAISNRALPQEPGSVKLAHGNRAEDRRRGIRSRNGSRKIQDVVAWVPNLAG